MAAQRPSFDPFAYLDSVYTETSNTSKSMSQHEQIDMSRYFIDLFSNKSPRFIRGMEGNHWAWLLSFILTDHQSSVINPDNSIVGIQMNSVYNKAMIAAKFFIQLGEQLQKDEHYQKFRGFYHDELNARDFYKQIWKKHMDIIYALIPQVFAALPPHQYTFEERGSLTDAVDAQKKTMENNGNDDDGSLL